MSGKRNDLTAREMHKQLLIVESELNRAQLVREVHLVTARVQNITAQISALGSLATRVGEFGPMVADFFKGFSGSKKNAGDEDDEKPSWFSRIFNGIRSGVDLWTTFRSERH